ncbi:MAG: outer membrane lipoprotein carrier protein LolA [Pseudomonadota bacterium]
MAMITGLVLLLSGASLVAQYSDDRPGHTSEARRASEYEAYSTHTSSSIRQSSRQGITSGEIAEMNTITKFEFDEVGLSGRVYAESQTVNGDEIIIDTHTELEIEQSDPTDLYDRRKPVFGEMTDDNVVAKVIDHLQSIDTLTADFEQSSPSGSTSVGKFWLRRPRQLRMQYGAFEKAEDDAPLLIVASQGFVYVRDNALETTDSYPVNKTPLRFLLSKKIVLDDLKVRAVVRDSDSVAVTFSDPDAEADGDLTAVFDAPALALRQWIVRDPQQGLTIVTLRNRRSGERVANRLFKAPDAGGQFLDN